MSRLASSLCARAVICFVLGLLSPALLFLTGVPALWTGVRALRLINASDGRLHGRRLAVAGMILGGLGCAAAVIGTLAIAFVELRVRSQRLECLNNLRQIGAAVLNYQSTNNAFPPGTLPNAALPPEKRLSWLTALPPFMEQKTKDARARAKPLRTTRPVARLGRRRQCDGRTYGRPLLPLPRASVRRPAHHQGRYQLCWLCRRGPRCGRITARRSARRHLRL